MRKAHRGKEEDHIEILPFHSLLGGLAEAPHVVIIHVNRARWTVNEPFCGQIDGQNRAERAQPGIDLSRGV